MIDPYAVAWTYFFDANGRALMRRNESTGNVTWFNYNAEGLPTAVGYPTGERSCFAYDERGNVVQALSMPRPGGLSQEIDPVCGTHVPIEARFSYIDSPTRLVDVSDPRTPIELSYTTSGPTAT